MDSVAPPTKSQPGSPIISENRISHTCHSIPSFFPPTKSHSGGSASNETLPRLSLTISSLFPSTRSQTESSESNERIPPFSHSIRSIFLPESSESNERLPPFSHSIPSIFPPETSESNERLITRSSHSIPSIFQPNKSDTASSDSVHKYSPSLSEVSNVVSSRPNTSIYVPDEFKDLHLSLSIDGNKSGSHKIVKSIARIAPCSTFKRKRTNTKVCLFTLIFVDFPL